MQRQNDCGTSLACIRSRFTFYSGAAECFRFTVITVQVCCDGVYCDGVYIEIKG